MRALPVFIGLLLVSCYHREKKSIPYKKPATRFENNTYRKVADIKTPSGFKRITNKTGSFGEWLRSIPLRPDKKVYLYNRLLKKNQSAQFAVMDISIGQKDLQQCADAVMRLRGEYLFMQERFNEIVFTDNNDKVYRWQGGSNRLLFDQYLENVFDWCGSASLEKQLKPSPDVDLIKPGDVFIKGGFPGHAMLVTDVAINDKGEKVFLLAQSYMPAQDIHIVKNPMNEKLSPWYVVKNG